ncbi:transmembrane protein, putative (macronuclear) [Tetrahymena thermophila SB210]|uniref:Transmembrane protein, putative n=1 Tax=Tetrahymena thermophila (strain SB210) TaxID=312017 RepID=W7XEA6_TETTS|nr:transmembrane protein, putative [Tetrahymena thermophila SB210]EWS74898.1 transmembrane protein, putative [Tetrahymena thermophila SB210]|eukprot:XP_012652611.1 transmembrane protein, putative [Tetrahymena thermophila SB210]
MIKNIILIQNKIFYQIITQLNQIPQILLIKIINIKFSELYLLRHQFFISSLECNILIQMLLYETPQYSFLLPPKRLQAMAIEGNGILEYTQYQYLLQYKKLTLVQEDLKKVIYNKQINKWIFQMFFFKELVVIQYIYILIKYLTMNINILYCFIFDISISYIFLNPKQINYLQIYFNQIFVFHNSLSKQFNLIKYQKDILNKTSFLNVSKT